jgi:hypothetical protein
MTATLVAFVVAVFGIAALLMWWDERRHSWRR